MLSAASLLLCEEKPFYTGMILYILSLKVQTLIKICLEHSLSEYPLGDHPLGWFWPILCQVWRFLKLHCISFHTVYEIKYLQLVLLGCSSLAKHLPSFPSEQRIPPHSPSAKPTNTLSYSALAVDHRQQSRFRLHTPENKHAHTHIHTKTLHTLKTQTQQIVGLVQEEFRLYIIPIRWENLHAYTCSAADSSCPMG